MITDTQQAERRPVGALTDVHVTLQELGKALTASLDRLRDIGNKLSEAESLVNKGTEKEPSKKDESKINPGIIYNLNQDCDGFSHLISAINSQLNKIEALL